MLTAIIIAASLDILGRVFTLMFMLSRNSVKTLSYRTWVLLCAFVNFAWVFYFIFGYKKGE